MNMTIEERWEAGVPHHPLAEEFYQFLRKTNVADSADWRFGGDGDNGEDILLALSEFFDHLDKKKKKKKTLSYYFDKMNNLDLPSGGMLAG